MDTNVRISALLCEGTARDCLWAITTAGHTVLTTPDLIDELDQVILRKSLIFTAEISLFHSQLKACEKVIDPEPNFAPVCRDPDDDRVLACAVAGSAVLIVTEDNDLHTLKPSALLESSLPRQFLNEFLISNPVP